MELFRLLANLIWLLYITDMAPAIPLYPVSIPNSISGPDEETSIPQGDGSSNLSKVSRPTLSIYLPKASSNTRSPTPAVIICPGGGYAVLAWDKEGTLPAKAFQNAGVAAFVLKYRLPDDKTMLNKSIGPLQDAQQALKMVRMNAKEWNIDPTKTGIMGFSAGGHLASTASTHFNKSYISNDENTSLRPDFQVLIYPVISFTNPKLTHVGSMQALLGNDASAAQKTLFSNELQITKETPPTFLVHAANDDVVPVGNSLAFFNGLNAFKTATSMHVYERGGHGFGMVNSGSKIDWFGMVTDWMRGRGLLNM
jgi:acetyl esterase/lipase